MFVVAMADQSARGPLSQGWAMLAVLVSLLLFGAVICGRHAWRLRSPRTLSIVLAGRRLIVVNGVLTVSGRPWQVDGVTGFSAGVAQPSVTRRQMIAALRVQRGLGTDNHSVIDLPRDECVWIAGILNAVLGANAA